MKKSIIAISIAMSSFGAMAAEATVTPSPVAQAVQNFEAFGKVTASYDAADVDGSSVEFMRNSEFGVRTAVEVGHGLTVTSTASVSFDAEDKIGLDIAEVGVEHAHGSAHIGKIKDRYDASTVKFDQFNDVFNGTKYELFSDASQVHGVALAAKPIAGLGLTVQFSNEVVDLEQGSAGELGDTVVVAADYAVAGVDLAAAYKSTKAVNEAEDSTEYKVAAGYGLKGFYGSVVYEKGDNHAVVVDQDIAEQVSGSAVSLAGSYKFNAITFKAGYTLGEVEFAEGDKFDVNTIRVGAEYDLHKDVFVHAGYAKIDSDIKALEDNLFTAGVTVRF